MGSVQPVLIEGGAHSRQTEPGIGHAVRGQFVYGIKEVLQKTCFKTLIGQHFSPSNRTRWLRNGLRPPCMAFPHSLLSQVIRWSRCSDILVGSTLVKTVVVLLSDSAVIDSSLLILLR